MNFCIILTTFKKLKEAKLVAKSLIDENLVACAQFEEIKSMYSWQSNVYFEKEIKLSLKAKEEDFDKINQKIKKLHSYETPEIIMIKITNINAKYLKWMQKQTKGKKCL